MHPGDHAFRDQQVLDVLATATPQPMYVEMMKECPVRSNPDGTVTLLRMADIQTVNQHRAVRGNGHSGGGIGAYTRPLIPLDLDGPEHTRWRKVLDPLFAPKRIAHLEPQIRELADHLLDDIVGRKGADIYREWCVPLPSSIFLSIMGIPQSDLPRFQAFVDAQLHPDPSLSRDDMFAAMDAAAKDLYGYFNDEFDRREASNTPGDDLLGWFITVERDGERLPRQELLDLMYLLMMAGLDTVASSLACILSHLARHPERREQLLADPSLWPSAIEELMRFETPVQYGQRKASVDLELPSGAVVPANTVMYASWSAANLDPDVFEDPLNVDLTRRPNPHIVFANGWHRCLGSHLARLELRAALEVFHRRIPNYAIKAGVSLRYAGVARAPRELPLVWT